MYLSGANNENKFFTNREWLTVFMASTKCTEITAESSGGHPHTNTTKVDTV